MWILLCFRRLTAKASAVGTLTRPSNLPMLYLTMIMRLRLTMMFKYLPFPWTDPIGRVYGGLQTLSKFTPVEIKRIALPNITDWPRKLVYLKRCLLFERYKLANGKDLVIINPHFEAYDAGGLVKKEQRAVVKKILEEEYAKGNYMVLGGDWNIAPPGFNVHKWEHKKLTMNLTWPTTILFRAPGGIMWLIPALLPTAKTKPATLKGETYKTIIDYFYVSPNIEVENIHGIDLGFNYSDHNPVRMRIKLKE